MIGFSLSEEQAAVRDAAHRFAAEVIRPVAARHDETGEFPAAAVDRALELGLLYGSVPEELGGPGLGLFEECLIAEEIAWGCAGFFAAWAASSLAMAAVLSHGDERQKERYVRGTLAGRKLCAFALSEPDAGSDAGGIRTRARREGDCYVLDGAKQWTTNAGHADFIVVFAATDPGKRHAGLSAFIVDRDTPGLRLGPRENMAGMRCADTRSLTLEGCVVPAENRLGGEGDGFRVAQAGFIHSRPQIAAAATGIARAAMEHAARHALERKAGGKLLTSYQAIQLMLADMASLVEASRLLTWLAAWRVDQGLRAEKESAMAKTFASDAAMRVTTDAVQIFGGFGLTRDYPVEKLMRDAKVMQIIEGANQVMRLVTAVELVAEVVRSR